MRTWPFRKRLTILSVATVIVIAHGSVALRTGGWLGVMTAIAGLAVIGVMPIVYDLGFASGRDRG